MLYPILYVLAGTKGASVKEEWMPLEEEGGWNLRFERPFIEWEMDRVEDLINVIKDKKIQPPGRGQNGVDFDKRRIFLYEIQF